MDKDYRLRKVLHILTSNSRTKTKDIAKEIKTTQQNVSHFLGKMVSDGLIKKYTLLVDSSKFGYNNFCVLIRLKKYSKNSINKMMNGLEEYSEITCIDILFGNFELLLRFTSPNASNFNKTFREILVRFSKEILDYEILTQVVQYHFSSNYLSKKKNSIRTIISGDRDYVKLDDMDREILDYLTKDARSNFSTIAAKLGATSKTIISRVRALENKHIIKGYSIVFDHRKIGVSRYHLFIKFDFVDIELEKKFISFTQYNDNIIELIKVFGKWDCIMIVETFGGEDFKKILFSLKEEFADIITDYAFLESEEVKLWSYLPILDRKN